MSLRDLFLPSFQALSYRFRALISQLFLKPWLTSLSTPLPWRHRLRAALAGLALSATCGYLAACFTDTRGLYLRVDPGPPKTEWILGLVGTLSSTVFGPVSDFPALGMATADWYSQHLATIYGPWGFVPDPGMDVSAPIFFPTFNVQGSPRSASVPLAELPILNAARSAGEGPPYVPPALLSRLHLTYRLNVLIFFVLEPSMIAPATHTRLLDELCVAVRYPPVLLHLSSLSLSACLARTFLQAGLLSTQSFELIARLRINELRPTTDLSRLMVPGTLLLGDQSSRFASSFSLGDLLSDFWLLASCYSNRSRAVRQALQEVTLANVGGGSATATALLPRGPSFSTSSLPPPLPLAPVLGTLMQLRARINDHPWLCEALRRLFGTLQVLSSGKPGAGELTSTLAQVLATVDPQGHSLEQPVVYTLDPQVLVPDVDPEPAEPVLAQLYGTWMFREFSGVVPGNPASLTDTTHSLLPLALVVARMRDLVSVVSLLSNTSGFPENALSYALHDISFCSDSNEASSSSTTTAPAANGFQSRVLSTLCWLVDEVLDLSRATAKVITAHGHYSLFLPFHPATPQLTTHSNFLWSPPEDQIQTLKLERPDRILSMDVHHIPTWLGLRDQLRAGELAACTHAAAFLANLACYGGHLLLPRALLESGVLLYLVAWSESPFLPLQLESRRALINFAEHSLGRWSAHPEPVAGLLPPHTYLLVSPTLPWTQPRQPPPRSDGPAPDAMLSLERLVIASYLRCTVPVNQDSYLAGSWAPVFPGYGQEQDDLAPIVPLNQDVLEPRPQHMSGYYPPWFRALLTLPTSQPGHDHYSSRVDLASDRAVPSSGHRSPPVSDSAWIRPLAASAPPPPSLDIVFLHGLNGNPFFTWRVASHASQCWVRAFLSPFCLQDSIFLAGYPIPADVRTRLQNTDSPSASSAAPASAPVLAPTSSGSTLQNLALSVLDRVSSAVKGRNNPLVLVSHSMGGLLIKQWVAWALAPDCPDPRAREVVSRLAGLVFYAVPHHGSPLCNLARWLPLQVPTDLVADMSPSSPLLRDLNAAVWKLTGRAGEEKGAESGPNDGRSSGTSQWGWSPDRARPLVLSFAETVPVSFGMLPVPASSADPGYGDFVPLDGANHFGVVKPRSANTPQVVRLVQFLDEVRAQVPPT